MKKFLLFSIVCMLSLSFSGFSNTEETDSQKGEPCGLFPVRSNGKWGFIDKEGNFVIYPQFDYAVGFSEGLAAVRIGDWETGKSGFINKEGKIVINLQFDGAGEFSEGLAVVGIGEKYGVIDKTGKIVYLEK